MTGFLRLTTGPEMAADHERRLRELERRLKASQSDIARGRRTESESQPTLIINATTANGDAGKLLWDDPDDTYTFNLGGFFTIQPDGDIEAAADCLVSVTAWADWANGGGTYSPAGTRHMLEVTNLQTYTPVSDYRYQHSTPYMVTTNVSAVGKLEAANPMWVTASDNAASSQGLSAYVAVTRLALL